MIGRTVTQPLRTFGAHRFLTPVVPERDLVPDSEMDFGEDGELASIYVLKSGDEAGG